MMEYLVPFMSLYPGVSLNLNELSKMKIYEN
jgi:hypothetical protein